MEGDKSVTREIRSVSFGGDKAVVEVGALGLAVAGDYGKAKSGLSGISIVTNLGEAIAGGCGLAHAHQGVAKVGDWGVAVGERVEVGNYGIAIINGFDGSGRVKLGKAAIAIVLTKTSDWKVFRGAVVGEWLQLSEDEENLVSIKGKLQN